MKLTAPINHLFLITRCIAFLELNGSYEILFFSPPNFNSHLPCFRSYFYHFHCITSFPGHIAPKRIFNNRRIQVTHLSIDFFHFIPFHCRISKITHPSFFPDLLYWLLRINKEQSQRPEQHAHYPLFSNYYATKGLISEVLKSFPLLIPISLDGIFHLMLIYQSSITNQKTHDMSSGLPNGFHFLIHDTNRMAYCLIIKIPFLPA